METAKYLVVHFDATEKLSGSLRELLESPSFQDAEIRQERLEGESRSYCERNLSSKISCFGPHVIFAVISPISIDQARALVLTVTRQSAHTPIIIVSEESAPREMLTLLELGATDFITPPLRAGDVLPRIWRILQQPKHHDQTLTRTLKETLGLKQLLGESETFVCAIRKIPLIARCDASILISGETGTGKELCARAIHYLSPRASQPFTPVNCAAIPLELAESELFGHQRGAFTGAFATKPGLISETGGGTLLLDEIDCLPSPVQAKILRFLQEKEYRPLGSTTSQHADVRVIAASNSDLLVAVREGRLRQDLYYRLNVIPIALPPLRDRLDDIPLLARHFLAKYVAEFDSQVAEISSDAIEALMLHDWPGNIRELEHVIERAVLLSEESIIGSADLLLPRPKAALRHGSFQREKARMVVEFERTYIEEALAACQGNITEASKIAQKNRRAFWQLIRKHGIRPQSYKPRSQ